MVQLTDKAKVKVNWKVSPYDFSPEKRKEIQVAFANKYNIPRDNVKVEPDFILPKTGNIGGVLSEVTTDNIQDPAFHKKLYLEYLKVNNIEDYDIEIIDAIDKDINSKIDYQLYNEYHKFSIKWIKWSNFQSYGADNYFDFTSLDNLVLLNGEPANQSGKTTFAVDLLHFLLFGKSGKWDKLEGLFNYTLPEETSMSVEGCILVDGQEYIIKRSLTRPALKKRTAKSTVTQKVEYYKVIGDSLENLEDYVDENGEDSRQTNKIIKESIGREDDFDLMMCITGSNLDTLIDEKPTEKGRLFSRWIGLLPLEEKDALAREKFNQTIKPSLLTNQYNREALKEEIEAYKTEIEECQKKVRECDKTCKEIDKEIQSLEEIRKGLVGNKQQIDRNVLKIDITTVKTTLQAKKNKGIENKSKLEEINKKIEEIGQVEFSVEEYDKLVEKKTQLILKQESMRTEAKKLMELIKHLKTSEYCPTCGKKLDNIDNTKQIEENQKTLDELIKKGKIVTQEVEDVTEQLQKLKEKRDKYILLNTITTQKAALEVTNEKLRAECLELINTEKEYNKNAEAIDKNNKLDISIRNTEASIQSKRDARDHQIKLSTQYKANVNEYIEETKKREGIITKITAEEKLIYNWKLYLEMVGKNGISKMVIRNALPIINARLTQMLEDVCNFDVNVEINNKNEITFNLVRDGITKNLTSGSGFERTAAALALRTVLADISTISRMNFLVLDEILGRVAAENYDKMQLLYGRVLRGYDFVFHITHIDSVRDWHKHIVTVTRTKEGLSTLKQKQNIVNNQKTERKETKKKTKQNKND